MCLTASNDSVTIILGAVLMAYIQDWRQRA
jgi:hypothetical protein